MVLTPTGLKQANVMAFLHVDSRRVICSPTTYKADDAWVVEQAQTMLERSDAMDLPVSYLVRDQDSNTPTGSTPSSSRQKLRSSQSHQERSTRIPLLNGGSDRSITSD